MSFQSLKGECKGCRVCACNTKSFRGAIFVILLICLVYLWKGNPCVSYYWPISPLRSSPCASLDWFQCSCYFGIAPWKSPFHLVHARSAADSFVLRTNMCDKGIQFSCGGPRLVMRAGSPNMTRRTDKTFPSSKMAHQIRRGVCWGLCLASF